MLLTIFFVVALCIDDASRIDPSCIGLSGETVHDVGGLAVNVFDNISESFTGVEVALVNSVTELHGLQIGLFNQAKGGRGLQIGLWNQSDFLSCPIIGIAR